MKPAILTRRMFHFSFPSQKLLFLSLFILTTSFVIISSEAADSQECKIPNIPDQSHFDFCEGVPQLQWDWDNSDQEIDPSSQDPKGIEVITGGRPPYTWTISGNGFSFDGAGKTTAQTNVPSITVYSETGSCGSASITVTDECTSVTGYVRATTGKWGAYQSTTDCNRFSDCDYGPNVNFTGSSHPYSTGSDWTICGKYLIRERGCVGSTWSTCSSNRHYRLTQCMDPTDYQCVSDAVSDSDHCQKNRPRIETYWPFNSYYFCPVKDLHIYGPTGLAYRYFMVYKYYYRETNYREWVCQ